MGKSSSSCFKIMGCGGRDAVDDDDLEPEEAKTSSDTHRWSFRKKSSRQRVLSNTVISEPVSVCSSKQGQEVSNTNYHSLKYSSPVKAQVQERPIETSSSPSDVVNTEDRSSSDKNTDPVAPAFNDTDAIEVQSVIRGYLARKKFHKLRSIVKLQAAVRGHLVRKQAIGTLRCIQAIIRMQALVRARHACQLVEKFSPENTKFQGKGDSFEKSYKTSIKNLLSNGLARQLLETTPKTKAIYIKCDLSKSDSAWKWLERWMAVTSSGVGQQQEQNLNHISRPLEENAKMADSEPAKEIPLADSSALSDSKFAPTELVMVSNGKSSSMTENTENFEFQTSEIAPENSSKSLLKDDVEHLELKIELLNTTVEDYTETWMVNEESLNSITDNKQLQPNPTSEILVETIPNKLECAKDSWSPSPESTSCEALENEGKKSVIGSSKPCNPAFVVAQPKFEELSSRSIVDQSVTPVSQIVASKSKTESQNIQVDSFSNSKEEISAESSMLHESIVQAAVSECGTEISLSSTLDSLDRSEMEGGEIVLEIGALEKQIHSTNADAENAFSISHLGGDEDGSRFSSDLTMPQRPDGRDQTVADLNASVDSVQVDQQPAEPTISDGQTYLEGMIGQASSPQGTPRSHATATDLHGTPSSDVSVNAKKSKKENSRHTHRQRSHLVGKRSPSNPNIDSDGKSSTENLTKGLRISTRHNSFGMAKTDHVDQEPRLSSSSSLPGYMQATASAKAKAHVITSQKSSPDLNDIQPKKRHSLPIENGKQSSTPRIQRSASQAPQSTKGNGAHSPHNSTERRWQR
ncbi:unnamed protein product [Musa acuminata var. zebrina]